MAELSSLTQYRRIIDELRGVRAREERISLHRAVLLALSITLLTGLLASALEALFYFTIEGRTLLFSLSVIAVLLAVTLYVWTPIRTRFSPRFRKSEDVVALNVGSHFPEVKDRLLDALQVYRDMQQRETPLYSPALVDAGFRDVADRFQTLDLSSVVDENPRRSALRIAGLTLLLCVLFATLLPTTLFTAAGRILQFGTDFAPPAPFVFTVTPGDLEAVKGDRLELAATTSSSIRQDILFHLREVGQSQFDAVSTQLDSAGRSVHVIDGIRSSIVYYAEAAGYRSKQYRIDVVDRPFVRGLRVKLSYPGYTRIPPVYLEENVGDIAALPGTRVSLEMNFNKAVRRAALVFADGTEVQATAADNKAKAEFTLRKDDSYHIALLDESDIPNVNPIEYSIKTMTDLAPIVEILEPGMNVNIDERMRLPMLMRISDDYGFSKLQLKYRLAASRYEAPSEEWTSILLPMPSSRELEMQVPYIWNLASINLVPEDVVSYFVEVYDNDIVNGPKVGRSQIFLLRLPSLDEVFARADSDQNRAVENLQETMKAAEEIQREMEKLQQELRQKDGQKLDWQQQKKVEDLMKRQEQMLKDVKRVNEQLNDLKREMEQHNILSEETLRKYEELDRLMREIDSPELRENMQRMSELMQQMSPEQMKEAMEQFTFNEENFRKSIERTIDLLKRIQIEQKVDELVKRAEEMAKQQESLAERTEQADPSNQEELDRLAEEQREMKKQMEAMQREMSELQNMMQEFPQEMPLDEMSEAQSEMNLAQMQQQMDQSANMCQGGNCQGAAKQQKQSAKQMRNIQQKMEQVKKKLNEDMQRMVQQAFRKALKETLELSKKQEDLKNRVAKLPEHSQQYRDALREQMRLMEQLNQTGNELMELAKKTFAVNKQMAEHLGKAMKQMQQSLQSLQNRDKRSGGNQQGGAMAELNEAARQISQGMQKSSQQGSSQGGSLMQQLRQMAQQQMNINQSMPTPQIGGMSQKQLHEMQRMMVQQQAVQKSLEELNKEAKNSEEGKRLLGDLERVALDMQEVVSDMQQNNVNPNTLQKQERILSRLLDASRSLRERDWEKQRRSRTGQDVARRGPDALDPSALDPQHGLQRDLRRAVSEGYSRDYEQLIRKYFEALAPIVGE